ncbi:MAG: family oxidoreductase [Ignavibacteria bacterium]|nr:family oxidoreductase [Ignavibacteria bacterium]
MEHKLYALILGVSSGFGASTALELAKTGYNIYGVHFDFASGRKKAEELRQQIESLGVTAKFYNANAADQKNRLEIIKDIKNDFESLNQPLLRVLLHSLAFGAIKPFFHDDPANRIDKKSLEMTMDVMANSLLYWVQDMFYERLLAQNSRIFALTSIGSTRAMQNYGAISGAKAAIEAYIRQLAVDLAPYKITANAILAGITDTPAGQKIPGFGNMLAHAREHNPFGRNTVPEDVAKAICMLSDEKFYWITGQTIAVDGGESILNSIELSQ